MEKELPYDDKKTYPTCISGSGASPDEECGGPAHFNQLKDQWGVKCYQIMYTFLEAITDENNHDKSIVQVVNHHELRQAIYWINVDKYRRRQVNIYLKYYANKDDRWRDAFDEVIFL